MDYGVPGLAILVTVLAFNLLGDGLRDAPRPTPEDLTKERSYLGGGEP